MPTIETLIALTAAQDAIIEALKALPEGGVWTLDRIAATVGGSREVFDLAVDGLAANETVLTDGEDIFLA